MPRTKHWSPPGGYLQYQGAWDVLMPVIGVQEGRDAEPAIRKPDAIIAPDGEPILYRWHIIPRRMVGANVYLHLQVADDPERPLHDHPWDNQSVILAGGLREVYTRSDQLINAVQHERLVLKGRTVHRRAEEAHRLFLAPGCTYAISLFSTGPVVREWGFWFESGWRPHTDVVTETADGRSIFKEPTP